MYNTVSQKAYMLKACPLRGGGGGEGNRKSTKKSRKLLFARQAGLKNWKFYIFLDRKIDQISGKGPLCQICTL